MNNSDIWHWCWRIVRIFVACLMASAALGVLGNVLGSFRVYESQLIKQAVDYNKNFLSDLFSSPSIEKRNNSESPETNNENSESEQAAEKLPAEKKITLIADKTGIQCVFELSFEKKSPLYNQLIKTLARPQSERFTEIRQAEDDYLGFVIVNKRLFALEMSSLEVNDQTGAAYFKFVSNQIPVETIFDDQQTRVADVRIYYGNQSEIWEKTTVNVNTGSEIKVIPNIVAPTSQSAEATRFDIVARPDNNELIFDISYPSVSTSEESQPISGVLQSINDGLPILNSLLIGFLYSLPFLLFFVLKRKNRDTIASSMFVRFSDIAALLLILYLGLAILNFTTDVAWFIPLWLNAGDFIRQFFGHPIEGALLLMTVFPTFIWSDIVRRWEKKADSVPAGKNLEIIAAPRKSIIAALAVISVVFFLLTVLLVVFNKGTNDLVFVMTGFGENRFRLGKVEINPLVYLFLPALYFSVLWALYELYGRFVWLKGLLIFFILIFFSAISHILYDYRLGRIFTAVIALPFMYSCLRLGYYLFTSRFFSSDRKNWSLFRRSMLMLCTIGLLFFLLDTSNKNLSIYGLVANLAYAVGRLGIFALLFVLLRVLRRHSESYDSWVIPKEIVDVGGVLALSFLFLPSRQWLFVLIVFITAYLLLKNWAVILLRNKKIPETRRSDTVRSVIREKIAINEGERGLRVLKKELLAEVGKNKVTFEDYESKTKALEEIIKKKRQTLSEKGLNYRDLMTLGAVESAWRRGKSGAFYGLLFSLPWIMLILFNLKKTALPDINFEILSVLTTAALALIQYPLQGFLFGYFYPHLRGEDGMWKGFNFFLLFFIPTFIATVFARPTTGDVWTSHLLWSLQLFIQSMLLGLVAGDYETLRRSGLNWRHLIEVHNLSALTVWGSSVLVAISAAITTLITSGASSLITIGVKALLPELPELPMKN
jgi:hypothetical protein